MLFQKNIGWLLRTGNASVDGPPLKPEPRFSLQIKNGFFRWIVCIPTVNEIIARLVKLGYILLLR